MKRALFVFAKLNPGLTYVQGMNELYAPLYYLFKRDTSAGAATHAEADAFFCFVDLISEFRDNFCQQLVRGLMCSHALFSQQYNGSFVMQRFALCGILNTHASLTLRSRFLPKSTTSE